MAPGKSGVRVGGVVSGAPANPNATHTSVPRPSRACSGEWNPGGMTPMTRYESESSCTTRPMTLGSPPNTRFQRPSLIITCSLNPGVRSAGSNADPSAGLTPSREK